MAETASCTGIALISAYIIHTYVYFSERKWLNIINKQ